MSSLNHHAQNAKRGPSALAHTGVSHANLYPHRAVSHAHGETLNYPVSSQTVLHKATTHTVFQSSSSTETAFSSGGFVDVRIGAGSLGVVKQFVIALECENKTAADIVLMPAAIPYLFDRVEVLCEGGNVQLARWEPFQLWAPFRHVDGNTWDLNYKLAMTPVGGILAKSSGPTTYYIPILGDCFCRNSAYLGHLKSDLFIRVWFRGPSAFPPVAFIGVSPPTLNSLSVIVEQDQHCPEERFKLHERAMTQSIDYRHGRPGFQSISENLSPNTRYSFPLTAVQGVVSELIVTIRASGAAGVLAYAFKPWASYELLDGSGASLTGGMPITYAYQKTIIDAGRQSSGAIDTLSQPSYPIVIEFGDAKADFLTGSITGYITFCGQERLVITTEGTLAAGAYEIRIEYLSVARVNINQGRITVLPS
jgi:hypothetical protein